MPNLGVPELLIILVVVLLLFGGTRLAGLGKNAGRALREFKEETSTLRQGDTAARRDEIARDGATRVARDDIADGEIVDDPRDHR